MGMSICRRGERAFAVGIAMLVAVGAAKAQEACPAYQNKELVPTDPKLCESLHDAVRAPGALPLAEYERNLGIYLRNFCHRDEFAGWVRDKSVRDTGPYVSSLVDGAWVGSDRGVHAPVVIWYSPEAAEWVRKNRGADDAGTGPDAEAVPDGAMLIKEMYPAPASLCSAHDSVDLLPTSGAAVMIRDSSAAHDGWYWGWFGWEGWAPDWPADPKSNGYPLMGFGQYCVNCHASARDNLTFSSARNMENEPGEPLAYLSQDEALHNPLPAHHVSRAKAAGTPAKPSGDAPLETWLEGFRDVFPSRGAPPARDSVAAMPSQTYDNVWMPANAPADHGPFVTSDQCVGCHDAGSTGLKFDMTYPEADSGKLVNMSPYATWRTSPMGLAGRDPIFFAQLASETQTFHPDDAAFVESTCLGCHGVLGERQAQLDSHVRDNSCATFTRDDVNAVPWPLDNPEVEKAGYGALARDGISCLVCHQMALGEKASEQVKDHPRNACVDERQAALNPNLKGLARTFTGSFLMNDGQLVGGPYEDPKTWPMQESLGLTAHHDPSVASSEVCATCHTVHLPVLHRGKTIGRVYEQTTYAEWAFSAFRSGNSVDGVDLPSGQGDKWQECGDCHLPSVKPKESKIASIQEVSGFPAADFTAPRNEVDLKKRKDFASHELVGLNMFLVRMARQFPEILGLRREDPMLVGRGVSPVVTTENRIYASAKTDVAKVTISEAELDEGHVRVKVNVENLVGHKFPSGVGFRRAFLAFEVLDARGEVLWASGRTDNVGRIVGADGTPVAGEVWWGPNCELPADRGDRPHQPHFQQVTREDQVQIYQELAAAPPDREEVTCGHEAEPQGMLTTSFLSICAEVKDNRLLPSGFLDVDKRKAIAKAFGANDELAEDAGSTAVGDDPDYLSGGSDTLTYAVPRSELADTPASVRARLYYQATPPFYLQDRFCTATGPDMERLYYLAGHLDLSDTPAEDWKLLVGDSGSVRLAAGLKRLAPEPK